MIFLLMALGGLAQIWAWRLVAVRYLTIWSGSVPALVTCGAAALISDRVALSPKVSVPIAIVGGLAAGIALFVATRGFLVVATASPTLRRASRQIYQEQGSLSTPLALLVSVGLAVPGEELFWRGLFQGQLVSALDGRTAIAAAIAWVAFVVANLASRNLAIAAGAIVGGAVWVALAWWTGGVLAPLACHIVWTGLMIAFPVVSEPAAAAT